MFDSGTDQNTYSMLESQNIKDRTQKTCSCEELYKKFGIMPKQIQFNCPVHGHMIIDTRSIQTQVHNEVTEEKRKYIAPSTLR